MATEMRSIAGDEGVATASYGRSHDRPIFFRQRQRELERGTARLSGRDLDFSQELIQVGQPLRRLRDQVAASLLDDVAICAALMPGQDEPVQKLSYRPPGFGGGEEDVGIEEDAHAALSAGRLLLPPQDLGELGFGLVEFADALLAVDLDG